MLSNLIPDLDTILQKFVSTTSDPLYKELQHDFIVIKHYQKIDKYDIVGVDAYHELINEVQEHYEHLCQHPEIFGHIIIVGIYDAASNEILDTEVEVDVNLVDHNESAQETDPSIHCGP